MAEDSIHAAQWTYDGIETQGSTALDAHEADYALPAWRTVWPTGQPTEGDFYLNNLHSPAKPLFNLQVVFADADGLIRTIWAEYTATPNMDPGLLASPTDFAAVRDGSGKIKFSWTDNSENESGFRIRDINLETVSEVGAGIEEAEYSLPSDQAGDFRLEVFDPRGFRATPWIFVAPPLPDPVDLAPGKPLNVTAEITEDDDLSFSWTDNSDNESKFLIEIRIALPDNSFGWKYVASAGRDAATFSVPIPAAGVHTYHVVADNGFRGVSDDVSVTSLGGPPPNAPTGIRVSQSGSDVMLSWTDNSMVEEGYKVEEGTLVGNAFVWAEIASLENDADQYVYSNATPGHHGYRLTVYNKYGQEKNIVKLDVVASRPMCDGQVVTVNLALGETATAGNDVILGTDGNDLIYAFAGNDIICAGAGNDTVYGDEGNDLLRGEGGGDDLRGGSGYDTLDGGPGNDDLYGGDGNDLLFGREGHDRLFGGTGSNTCDGGGNGLDNDYITECGTDPPAAPTKMKVEWSGRDLILTWQDNSLDEEGFTVEEGTSTGSGFEWTEIESLDANTDSYIYSDPTPGHHGYRVVAFNTHGRTPAPYVKMTVEG